jgi:hypothetical protein
MTTTSAALERQAETVRADLSATLEDLRGNMTRAALAGGAAALAKEGAAAVARAVTRRASDHPLATLLIGAGLVMLLSNGKANTSVTRILGRVTSEPRGSDGARVAAQQAAGQAMDWAADKTSEAVTSAHSAAVAAADVVSTTKDKAGDLVSRGRDQVIAKAHDVEDTAGEFKDRLLHLTKEQPILAAALAVGAGAVLAALLPITAAERRYLGPSGARVTKKGHAVAEHVGEALSGKAEDAVVAAVGAIAEETRTGSGGTEKR